VQPSSASSPWQPVDTPSWGVVVAKRQSILTRCLPRAVVLWWMLGALLCGCAPKIHSFSIEPRRACPGDTLRIHFAVTGTPHLEVIATAGAEPETLTYTLVVDRHGKSTFARQDVVRLAARQEWSLAFVTAPLGPDSVVTSDTLRADDWNSAARLATVGSRAGRALRVEHGGRSAILSADGQLSDAFAGLSLAGPWRVVAALQAGEIMGDLAHAPPTTLRLRTTLACRQAP